MQLLTLQTQISTEQLYSLLEQLPLAEKYALSYRLRADASREEWVKLSTHLPDVPEFTIADVLNEIKTYRKEKNEAPKL
jgi:hypothetical protein